jgi:CRP-like cAMP-binding protein
MNAIILDVAGDVGTTAPGPLLEHPLFAGLDAAAVGTLLRDVRIRRLRRGDAVDRPGVPPSLHVVVAGRLCLFELTTDGRRIILDYIGPGGVDGMLGLAGMESHFSVVVEAGEVASFSAAAVDRIAAADPGFGFNLLAIALGRLRRREEQLERIALRDPDQRIAGQLLALAAECQDGAHSPRWRVPRLSHEALADMLALRRETVTLHLGRLRRSGAIRMERRHFELDRERLEAMRDGRALPRARVDTRRPAPSPQPEPRTEPEHPNPRRSGYGDDVQPLRGAGRRRARRSAALRSAPA